MIVKDCCHGCLAAPVPVHPRPRAVVRVQIVDAALWVRLYDEVGAERAHAAPAARDPAAAAALHANDRRRVVRALELAEAGASLRPARDRLWSDEARHATLIVGLEVPPAVLAARIEERTRAMVARGVVAEAKAALAGDLSATARKTIGLEEFATLPPDEAVAAVVLKTRQYAAYQRKWLRRLPGAVSVSADRPPDATADAILEVARARQRLPAGRAG